MIEEIIYDVVLEYINFFLIFEKVILQIKSNQIDE